VGPRALPRFASLPRSYLASGLVVAEEKRKREDPLAWTSRRRQQTAGGRRVHGNVVEETAAALGVKDFPLRPNKNVPRILTSSEK
jgi:hypothetical protein